MAPIAVMALALPAAAAISTSAANSTRFSIMLRWARLARPAQPFSSGRPSRLPARVLRPTAWLAPVAAISIWTKQRIVEKRRYFRSGDIAFSLIGLFGPEETVARIAEPGNNIPVIVEFCIDRGREHRHAGLNLGEGPGALFRAQNADEFDSLRALLLQTIHSGDRRMGSRQHGIAHQHVAVGDVLRDLEVVLDRLQRARIAVEPDMALACQRHQLEQPFGEPEAGAQDGHDHQLLAVEQRRLHRGDGSLDALVDQRQVLGGVVAQQQADLAQEPAEIGARRL